MMSQIVLSDDELELGGGSVHSGMSDSETNLVNATTKQVSSSTNNKNYYEVSLSCSYSMHTCNTVFCRINALGTEAENEPLSLADSYETNYIDTHRYLNIKC